MKWLLLLVAACYLATPGNLCYLVNYNNHLATVSGFPCQYVLSGSNTFRRCRGGCESLVRYKPEVNTSASDSIASPDGKCLAKMNCCKATTTHTISADIECWPNVNDYRNGVNKFTQATNVQVTVAGSCACRPCYVSGNSVLTSESEVNSTFCQP